MAWLMALAAVLGVHDHLPPVDPEWAAHLLRFQPSRAEASEAKRGLLAWLAQKTPEARTQASHWRFDAPALEHLASDVGEGELQYVGARQDWRGTAGGRLDPHGERIVIVHGFCSAAGDPSADLDRREAIVSDGGACLFDAWYSLDAHRIRGVSFHGVA